MIEYYKNLSLESLFYIAEDGRVLEEEWRDVPEWDGYYRISILGRLKSLERKSWNGFGWFLKSEKILTQTVNKKGYCRIGLNFKNKRTNYSVHRLVADSFIENTENLPEVNHKKIKQKTNNAIWNLEWSTGEDNRRHRSINEKTTSKYVGVSWDKFRNKWSSEITVNKKKIKFGRFDSELDAYMARYNYELENNISNSYRQEP